MYDVLSKIGSKLNDANVTWAVGASILLSQYGLIDKPNDIDLIVHLDDIEVSDKLLSKLGHKIPREPSEHYSTRYFNEYIINDVEIDVMAGLTIHHAQGEYTYMFDNKSVVDTKQINGVPIPFTSLEDWYILYQIIPDREDKVKLIEAYLIKQGISHMGVLTRSLHGNLPDKVVDRINKLMKTRER